MRRLVWLERFDIIAPSVQSTTITPVLNDYYSSVLRLLDMAATVEVYWAIPNIRMQYNEWIEICCEEGVQLCGSCTCGIHHKSTTTMTCPLNINKVTYVSSHSIALLLNIHLLFSKTSIHAFFILTNICDSNFRCVQKHEHNFTKVAIKIPPLCKSKLKGIKKVLQNLLSSFWVVSWRQERRGSNTNRSSNTIANF